MVKRRNLKLKAKLKAVHHILVTSAETWHAFNSVFDGVNQHRPTMAAVRRRMRLTASGQGLTLVNVRAQLELLQDTFMTYFGLYGGRKSSG